MLRTIPHNIKGELIPILFIHVQQSDNGAVKSRYPKRKLNIVRKSHSAPLSTLPLFWLNHQKCTHVVNDMDLFRGCVHVAFLIEKSTYIFRQSYLYAILFVCPTGIFLILHLTWYITQVSDGKRGK
jgi:hypothetical protein